jgi:hypothetical protein
VSDRIVLTIPAESGFEAVAQLVLGGVAARLNLTYENLDDLGTALETLLERRDADRLTVELELADDAITTTVGPLRDDVVEELDDDGDGVGLRRVLDTVTDGFGSVSRDGAQWVQLRKSVDRAGRGS